MKTVKIISLLLVGCVLGCYGWENKAKPWRKLEHCRIVESFGNDGDSFHIKHGSKEYVFRLCYADCPESSMSYPERVHEQAEWWGITDEDVVRAGNDAKKFTMKLLDGRDFTVYTKFTDARGRSKLGREFAMIKVGDKWLCERLVAAGLARSYGYTVTTPDGISRRDFRRRLDALELEAKAAGRGAWGYAAKGESATGKKSDAGYEITVKRPLKLYPDGNSMKPVAILPAGSRLRVLEQSGRWRIKVSVTIEGECDRSAVEELLKH